VNSCPPAPVQSAAAQEDALAGLLATLRVTRPCSDVELIRRAYDVAALRHQGQRRKSGDPYITHPLAVAAILAGTGADDEVLCAALLHDTIVDTPYTAAALARDFGPGITALVTGVGALDQAKAGRGSALARAMMTALESADVRVQHIKIADRLHNMQTVEFMSQAKQLRKARESLDIFAPAASRLRMGAIDRELETLAHATMKRNRYARSTSGRLLAAVTVLLPAATRTRWREEWLGELHTLPARRDRIGFAAHTAMGIPRLALTARLLAEDRGRPG
jgi:GTP diphosphokinase / guanosine-3',5'-bis(diphosphate) 3'-diphosphatase